MKNLILLTLLFTSQIIFAASNTIGLKGQTQSTVWEAGRIQFPNSQTTLVGDKNILVENGNSNVLVNPSFEHATVATGWTTAGTAVAETTEIAAGKKSLKITLAAYTGDILVQSYTPTEKWSGLPIKASAAIKTSLSDLQLCLRINSVDLDCTDISNANVFQEYLAAMPGQNGVAHAIVLKSVSSVTGDVYVDKSELGIWAGAKSGEIVTPWTDYTPTLSATSGTLPARTLLYSKEKRRGEDVYFTGAYQFTATGTWANPTISAPPGLTLVRPTDPYYRCDVTIYDANGDYYPLLKGLVQSNKIIIYGGSGTNGAYTTIAQNFPITFASGDRISWFCGPIAVSEWAGQGSMNFTTNPVQDYSFRVSLSSTASLAPNASAVKVTMNRKSGTFDSDPSNSYNTSTGLYTASISGDHDFIGSVGIANTNVIADTYRIEFWLNGTTRIDGGPTNPVANTSSLIRTHTSKNVPLKAGDTVEMRLYSGANHSSNQLTLQNNDFTWFAGGPSGTVAKNVTVPQSVTTPYLGVTVINTTVSKSANYTATSNDETIKVTADATLTLPSIAGKKYHIINSGSGTETTITPASGTICGNSSIILAGDRDSITIQFDGTNWDGLHGGCFVTRSTYIEYSSGTPSSTNQRPNGWISSVTDVNTGRFIIVPKSNIWSGLPMCSIITRNSSSTSGASDSGGVWSNNSFPFVVGSPTDVNAQVVCYGSR